MTARPLWQAMRQVTLAVMEEDDAGISETSKEVLIDLLAYLNSRVEHEIERRNNILHGAWLTGFTSKGQEDFEEMLHTKWKATNKGLVLAENPKSPKEFEAACVEIKDLTRLIERLGFVFAPPSVRLPAESLFQKVGDVWKPKNG
jgi:hypothetical protein